MGQAKRRGTEEERRAEGQFKRALLKQKFEAWQKEVEEFRKTFGLDVGIIGGAPPESRLVVCNLDALKARLLGLQYGASEKTLDEVAKKASEEAKSVLTGKEG